jgi:DNA-binding SARP family transcriptional activator
LSRIATSSTLRNVAIATRHVLAASLDGDLDETVASLTKIIEDSAAQGLLHYQGVGLLNRSLAHRARGSADAALRDSIESLAVLGRASAGSERLSAELAQAWALAHAGDLERARSVLKSSYEQCTAATTPEWLAEAALVETLYGDETIAESILTEAQDSTLNPSLATITGLTRVQLEIRRGRPETALALVDAAKPAGPTQESGYLARYLAIAAHVAFASRQTVARDRIREASNFARRQGAGLWAGYCEVLASAAEGHNGGRLQRIARRDAAPLSMAAEAVVDVMFALDDESVALITREASSRPDRWRPTIRRTVLDAAHPSRLIAAKILDVIGSYADVPLLRDVARTERKAPLADLGRGLARRLAEPVLLDDQGRVEIRIGTRVKAGSTVRRKVLALLCFLVTRPKFAATRDEVIDALWPDLAPEVALNSLNQTIYFLRRVFEPAFKDDTSAGYVHHSSDVVWLDSELIDSRSARCRHLMDAMGSDPSPAEVEVLSQAYAGRFALDFAYEDWALAYRDSLHVSYLQRIEAAVSRDIDTGHFERGIRLARRALDIDPQADGLELSLVRMYRATGAHAAAAEQYEHYASAVREELGIEPPPLSAL